jgi:hypothetical protein
VAGTYRVTQFRNSEIKQLSPLYFTMLWDHGGYPLRIFFDQICVPYCFSLAKRICVAQMDVSLQGSDENSTKGDHVLFYYLTEHCNILTEQIDQVCPFGYNVSYISWRDNDASQDRNTNNVISFSKIIDNVEWMLKKLYGAEYISETINRIL